MNSKKVLIIIPAFNEARSIERLVKDLKTKFPRFDVVIINDHSTDETEKKAADAGACVVTLPFNLGLGGAVQTGFKIAAQERYDAAVQIDGDGQHDPVSLPAVLNPVLSGSLDLCVGSRFLLERSPFKSTAFRRIGIRFFSVLLSFMTGIHLTDPTSGFRASGSRLIERFAEYYPVDFPEPEAVKMAKRFGMNIGETAVKMRKRLGGRSSIRYFSAVYYMVKVTFAILIDALKRKKD